MCGVSDGDSSVARPSIDKGIGDVLAAGGGEGVDHVENTGPGAAAEVADEVLWFSIQEAVEGGFVAVGKIHHMDVVAHPGAVMGRPVAAKHLELIATSDGDLGYEGEEVVGDAEGVFPDLAAGVGAYGVEVAKASDPPGVGSTGIEVGEHLFNRSF